MKSKVRKKNNKKSTMNGCDDRGALSGLIRGARVMSVGLGVLAINDNAFYEMIESDDDYREMMVEILKSMIKQAGYESTCTELAAQAREKIMAALLAHGDLSFLGAFDPAC